MASSPVRIDGHKGANAGGKVATLVAGVFPGADSIDDTDDLRSGGMPSLSEACMPQRWPERAPSDGA